MNLSRKGKIARLPRQIREQLNQRLADGELGTQLVEWLNSLPEAQASLARLKAQPISEQNLSEWKAGGYRDWLAQQEALEMIRDLGDDAQQLDEAAGRPLADRLALWLVARYVVATRLLRDKDDAESFRLLRELCADIVELRKGDHSAERLRIEREEFELEREQAREKTEEEFWEWARENREEICRGFRPREEVLKAVRLRLFGSAPGDGPLSACPADLPKSPADATDQTKSDQIRPNQTK